MRKQKWLLAKHFLENHAKTRKNTLSRDNISVVVKNFSFATKYSNFVARQSLFKTFPFSECVKIFRFSNFKKNFKNYIFRSKIQGSKARKF